MTSLRILLLYIACAATCASFAQRPAPTDDPLAVAIASQLDASMHDGATIHGTRVALQARVHEFYARRGFRAAWSNARNAAQLHRALEDSRYDGLDPSDYHLPVLQDLAEQLTGPGATSMLRAQYDVLLTEALLRLAYHVSFGKVDPETFDPQWNYARTLASTDVAQEVEDALAREDIYERVEALKPSHPLYVGLKRELARYRAATDDDRWQIFPSGESLKPGMTDARVPLLRARLILSGDASGPSDDSTTYDPALERAVRTFQERMGLDVDGIIGPRVVAALNVAPADRVRQLRINLDRARVVLRDLPERFVVVNIAGFKVYLVRGEKVVWEARVQVGKPYRRTPIFRSAISYVVLNPTWTVPPGIIANDILPAARRDPESITRKGLKVIDSNGREHAPHTIDWTQFKSGHIPYTLRQDPGPSNALGRAKLMFPNPYLVYLHDTPSQALFDRADRAFSSGCVRVERALELAELVLDDAERWNAASIAKVIDRGEIRNVTLAKPIPVLLTYWTVWVDPEGRVNFRQDLYGQDAQWAKALDAEFKVRTKPLFSAAHASR
jgi:murein L,D-transpeptidase YcbB/YkuD